MSFLKSLFFNFICVFFVNHLIPGIAIAYYSKLPKIEGGIIFAFSVGLANSLVFPLIRLFQIAPSHIKIGIVTFVISFAAYSVVNIIPVGIKVESAKGFLIGASIVWVVAYITNHIQFSKYRKQLEEEAVLRKKEDELKREEKRQEKK